MLNDDDKDKGFESQEESEYHFSDDEANYEVEPEPAKPEAPKEEKGSKANFLNKLTQSKRMLISGGVFILLIFVVYKMVTPTSTPTPSTDIMMATTTQAPISKTTTTTTTTTAPASTQAPSEMAATTPSVTAGNPPTQNINQPSEQPTVTVTTQTTTMPPQMTTQSVGVTQPAVSASGVAMQQSTAATAGLPAPGGGTQIIPSPVASTSTTQTTVAQTTQSGNTPIVSQAPQAGALPLPGAQVLPAGSAISQASSAVMNQANQAIQQGVELAKTSLPLTTSTIPPGTTGAPTQTTGAPTKNAEQNTTVGMPAVIPVQSPIPTTIATIREQTLVASPTSLAQSGSLQTPLVEKAQNDLASLQSKSEQLMNQLQAEYARKLDEYSSQNKTLQNEMQNLNAKVAGLESQLSQLLQVLMRPHEAPPPVAPREPETAVVEQRMTYNVQAIIPGRAWLKSQNGETVTVAEGDVVRDLGRITKIDPYDGVVEINTGSKVVALSYGNGG